MLTPADIEAIAAAVVRKLKEAEKPTEIDHAYEARLPVEEQKRLQKARMREWDREQKESGRKAA